LKVTISIAVFNKVQCTREFLASLVKHTNLEDVQVIIIDNASVDETPSVLEEFQKEIPHFIIDRQAVNIGFGLAHNLALTYALGEYFIVINNDIVLQSDKWMNNLIEPLEKDTSIGLVGGKGTPTTLRMDGTGGIGKILDYVDGSILCGRSRDFLEYGLFSKSMTGFFYEDSDLSLRFRQMGKKLSWVEVDHVHSRSSTIKILSEAEKRWGQEHNARVFMARWERYLVSRTLSNKILVKISSDGIGDVLACTPILQGLRVDHPKSTIEVETTAPAIFENNPFINGAWIKQNKRQGVGYDRVVDTRGINYGLKTPIAKQAAFLAQTHIEDIRPQLFMTKIELEQGNRLIAKPKRKFTIAVSLLMGRTNWQGRNWNLEAAEQLVKMLTQQGITVVEVGHGIPGTGVSDVDLIGKTQLRELFSVIANCNLFVGIDSLGFHIAQSFGIPTVALFGATEPISRVVNFRKTAIVRSEGLNCLGCYQKKGLTSYNVCTKGNEGCMKSITAKHVMAAITDFDRAINRNLEYLYEQGVRL
jgi:ADP-heptose:LPS heptosyltransferase/GT2 family glycosyltransferase